MNRWVMNHIDHSLEERSISKLNKNKFEVQSMTTCIVFSRNGKEAFVVNFKDSVLKEGLK